jgi:hypothetical protein
MLFLLSNELAGQQIRKEVGHDGAEGVENTGEQLTRYI